MTHQNWAGKGRAILPFIFLLIFTNFVSSNTYMSPLTRSIADKLYCSINGGCLLNTMNITGNLTIEGNAYIRGDTYLEGDTYFQDLRSFVNETYINQTYIDTITVNATNGYFSTKVGVGTSSPTAILEVAGTQNTNLIGAVVNTVPSAGVFLQTSQLLMNRATTSTVDLNITTTNSGVWGADGGDILLSPNRTKALIVKTNGYVGIGTTNPNASLEVTSSDTTYIHLDGGTNAFFDIDRSTIQQAGRIRFQTNGTDAVEMGIIGAISDVFSITDGSLNDFVHMNVTSKNMGIGIKNPTQKLHISGGDLLINESSGLQMLGQGIRTANRAELFLHANGDNVAEIFFGRDARTDANEKWTISSRTSAETNDLIFYKAPNVSNSTFIPVLTLDGASVGNNVGIGTSSPSSPLHISSDDFDLFSLVRTPTGATTWIFNEGVDGSLIIRSDKTSSNNLFTIQNGTGFIGIGTADISQKLTLQDGAILINKTGTTGNDTHLIISGSYSASESCRNIDFKHNNISQTVASIGVCSKGGNLANMVFSTAQGATGINTPRVIFTHTGNVGIGTQSPTQRLTINGNISLSAPNGTYYNCGVSNIGVWGCS